MTDKTGYNERVKLLAQVFHNLAVACVVGGFLVPVFAANLAESNPNLNYITTGPVGIGLAAGLVFLGQMYLKTMWRD